MPFCGFTSLTLMARRKKCQLLGIVIPNTGQPYCRTYSSGPSVTGPAGAAARRGGHHHCVAEEKEGRKAIFRVPAISLVGVAFLVVCLAPTAFAGIPGLWALYVVPLAMLVFVVRTRTVATAKGLTVRTMFGHRELPWEALKGLAISPRAQVRAVLADDTQVPLPTVRTRHLPVISLVSEGRFADPSGLTDDLVRRDKDEAVGETADATTEKKQAEDGETTSETADENKGDAE